MNNMNSNNNGNYDASIIGVSTVLNALNTLNGGKPISMAESSASPFGKPIASSMTTSGQPKNNYGGIGIDANSNNNGFNAAFPSESIYGADFESNYGTELKKSKFDARDYCLRLRLFSSFSFFRFLRTENNKNKKQKTMKQLFGDNELFGPSSSASFVGGHPLPLDGAFDSVGPMAFDMSGMSLAPIKGFGNGGGMSFGKSMIMPSFGSGFGGIKSKLTSLLSTKLGSLGAGGGMMTSILGMMGW